MCKVTNGKYWPNKQEHLKINIQYFSVFILFKMLKILNVHIYH